MTGALGYLKSAAGVERVGGPIQDDPARARQNGQMGINGVVDMRLVTAGFQFDELNTALCAGYPVQADVFSGQGVDDIESDGLYGFLKMLHGDFF